MRSGWEKKSGFFRIPTATTAIWETICCEVVDTGLHYKHWTRQQVVDYFHQHSAEDEPSVQAETDRYIVWPGQALGYKIGQLEILKLRQYARDELKDRFDIRAFHDEVLNAGATNGCIG